MSKISDFFQKNPVVTFISGRMAERRTEKFIAQGFGRAILSQPPVFLSDKEVEAIKASVPKAKSDAIKLSFNRDLYDSIVANEKEGASTEQAIESAYSSVKKTYEDSMPKFFEPKSAEDYVLASHIDDTFEKATNVSYRQEYSYTTKIDVPTYTYRPEFKKELKAEIDSVEQNALLQQNVMHSSRKSR